MTGAPDVFGIVLAGGGSRRMGRDKATLALAGRSLLSWSTGRLAPQCRGLVVSRHDGPLPEGEGGWPVVGDDRLERAGPLAGLLAGLDWIARHAPAASHAVSVAVDTPFLPADLVDRLRAAARMATTEAACAASAGRRHPVAALWPVAARDALRAALADEGLRRIGAFLDRLAPAVATWSDDPVDPFFNLNTPEDAAAAERIAGRVPPA